MADVTMPQLGETVTEGTITKWFKKVGDRVEADEVLFEVSTDKVDSEVSAPSAGFVTEIRVVEGTTVDVGVILAVISAEAVTATAPAEPAPVAPEPAPSTPPSPVVEAPLAPSVVEAPVAVAPPTAVPIAVVPVEAPAAPTPPVRLESSAASTSVDAMDKVLSPVVRKLIHENNLDPATIVGTGIGGRITREDVLASIDRESARAGNVAAPEPVPASAPAPTAAVSAAAAVPAASVPTPPAVPAAAPAPSNVPAVAPPSMVPAVRSGSRDQVVPFSNIRRRTGEHMVMSLQTSPHAFIAVEVDYTGVDRVRTAKKDAFKAEEGFSLTYMPFIARAVVEAMQKFPHVNASVAGDSLVVHADVHLGVAVDLDFQGLMVPVVKSADAKRMRAVARDIADLASRARSKKLTPDDISGGTFTLSNAGPYGIDLMQSVINQPQVGILSITSVSKKAVVVTLPDGSDTIAIRPMGMLGLSWDHRAFDGAYAASFLAEVRSQLQSRDWSTEV